MSNRQSLTPVEMLRRINGHAVTNRPNFTRRWIPQQSFQQQIPRNLSVPQNRFNIFTDLMRIYGHNCFHLRNMTKMRAMLYAHVYDSDRDKLEDGIQAVVADAKEFAEAVSEERADIAIEVLYIAAHLCEKYSTKSNNITDIVLLQTIIFNHQMNYYRRRAWMMCTEEKVWVKRYSISRFFSFLNVILPEIASGGGMDNLYPYTYDGEDDEAMIPFLSNFALTSEHLQALDFFLNQVKLVFEFRSSAEVGVIPLPVGQDAVIRWPFPMSRALTPGGMFDYDDPSTEPMFDDYYARPAPIRGPTRSVPKDIEYRWQVSARRVGGESTADDESFPPFNLPTHHDQTQQTLNSLGYNIQECLGSIRFVDFPVKTPLTYTTALGLACQASHPAAVKILLQNGATAFFNSSHHRQNHVLQCLEEPFGIVARILNRGRSWRHCSIETISRETLSRLIGWEEEEEVRMVQILDLMLRAVTHFPIRFYSDEDEQAATFITDGAVKDLDTGRMTFHLHERFKDFISPESASGAPALKQICRCSIREVLHSNWKVKHGIDKLPLPTLLKDYVALNI